MFDEVHEVTLVAYSVANGVRIEPMKGTPALSTLTPIPSFIRPIPHSIDPTKDEYDNE